MSCGCGCSDKSDYMIANIDDSHKMKLKELENKFKSETGKDVVLIAWEKK